MHSTSSSYIFYFILCYNTVYQGGDLYCLFFLPKKEKLGCHCTSNAVKTWGCYLVSLPMHYKKKTCFLPPLMMMWSFTCKGLILSSEFSVVKWKRAHTFLVWLMSFLYCKIVTLSCWQLLKLPKRFLCNKKLWNVTLLQEPHINDRARLKCTKMRVNVSTKDKVPVIRKSTSSNSNTGEMSPQVISEIVFFLWPT